MLNYTSKLVSFFKIHSQMTKKITLLCLLYAFSFNFAFSQLTQFNFSAAPYLQSSSTNSHVSTSDFAISSGSISTNVTTGTYFVNEPYIQGSSGWGNTSEAEGKYFSFDITAQAGKQFSISQISLDVYATGAGPSAISIFINDVQVYINNIGSSTLTRESTLLNLNNLTNANIKIIGWDNSSRSTSGGGSFRLDSVVIEGLAEAIPPKNINSSYILGDFEIPATISSLHNTKESIQILDFYFIDSASSDASNTLIDSLIFTQELSNDYYELNSFLEKSALIDPVNHDTIWATINDTSIKFIPSTFITILEGIINKTNWQLNVWLKANAELTDGKSFKLNLSPENVYCNAQGSSISNSFISTGNNNLKSEVIATKISIQTFDDIIWQDSMFNISLIASDANGNIDSDFNEPLTIYSNSKHGTFSSPNTTIFNNGTFQSSEFKYSATDTILFNLNADGLTSISQKVKFAEPFFTSYFSTNTSSA